MFGVEYGGLVWSNYCNSFKEENLLDSYYFVVGGEYIFNNNLYNNYWEKICYCLGFCYGIDLWMFDG